MAILTALATLKTMNYCPKKRAEAVKAFFIKHGVSAKNIELRRPESTIGAQGKNQEGRRVEVQITD